MRNYTCKKFILFRPFFTNRRTIQRCSFQWIFILSPIRILQGASYSAMHAQCNKSRDIMLECLLSVRAEYNRRVNNFVAQSWRKLARQLIVRSGYTYTYKYIIHTCIHAYTDDRLFRKKSNNKLPFSLNACGLLMDCQLACNRSLYGKFVEIIRFPYKTTHLPNSCSMNVR